MNAIRPVQKKVSRVVPAPWWPNALIVGKTALLTEIGLIIWGADAVLGIAYLTSYLRARSAERQALGSVSNFYANAVAPALLAAAFACFGLDLVI